MKGEHTDAAEAPRMKLDTDGNWRGDPRMSISRAFDPTKLRVTVYTDEPPQRAQLTLSGDSGWYLSLYSRPDQLREMAALFTEAANLIDMLALVDRSAADHEDADSEIAAAEVTP